MNESNVVPIREEEPEQQEFFGMPVKSASFAVNNAKGGYEGELTFDTNVEFQGRGRVRGVLLEEGKRIWRIEALETNVRVV